MPDDATAPVEHVTVVVPPTPMDREREFEAFMLEATPALARTAWLLCGDVHRAEDLVQQALMRTYVSWSTARQRDPLAYTRRVLANLRIDTWRKHRREVLTPLDELPHEGVDSGADERAERDRLVRALSTLTARQRRIVVLRHLVGLSEREVADDLGVSLGTVKSTASRGLAQLRAALAEGPDGSARTTPMTNDLDFAAHLRDRLDVIAPDVDVDTSIVVRGGRRRWRATVLGGVAATTLVLAGGGWLATAALPTTAPRPASPSDGWTAPAWFAEQAEERAVFRAQLQACMDGRGWDRTVDEWGGEPRGFSTHEEVDRFMADVDDCSRSLGRDVGDVDPETALRNRYPMLVDTWECVVHEGYDVPPPPSEDELVRQYRTTDPGADADAWNPYGDLDPRLMSWEELERTCPLPW